MDLKERYFFLPDFILPYDGDNIVLKQFLISDINKIVDFNDYSILPIQYNFQKSAYILLLINNKFISLQDLKDRLLNLIKNGTNNLFNLSFKSVDIIAKNFIHNYKSASKNRYVNIILKYQVNISEDEKIEFYVMIPLPFLKQLINFIFNSEGIEDGKLVDIKTAIEYLKYRLYRDSITSFWELDKLIENLTDKEIQRLNLLLSNNMIEETMLTGFIAGFVLKKRGEIIYRNLSKNLKKEIEKNLNLNFPDKRWIDECFYLIKSSVEQLIFEEKLQLDSLKYISNIKERIKIEKYKKIFKDKPFEDWIIEADKKGVIYELKLLTPNKILCQSLLDVDEKIISIIEKELTANAKKRLEEDIEYEKNNCNKDDIMLSQITIIENLRQIYYEREAKQITDFNRIILSLSKIDLRFLIEEVGILQFSQATIKSDSKLKKYIYLSTQGPVKNLLIDIYSGKIRFKSAFGDLTIKEQQTAVIKKYLELKNEKKLGPDISVAS